MSHLRPDNTNVPASAEEVSGSGVVHDTICVYFLNRCTQPLNSLVPPQEEKVPVETEGKRTCLLWMIST